MAIELITYDDMVQHLVDVYEFNDATRMGRLARIAVDSAYTELPAMYRWRYFEKRTTFKTVASYNTGSITYDHTGGSNERELTLASGTWPSWAKFGRITISDVEYRVESRVSDTVLTLHQEDNPGADVAAGTTYTIARSAYPAPINFRKLIHMIDRDYDREISIVGTSTEHHASTWSWDQPETPWIASIRAVEDYYGILSFVFVPAPSAIRSYDITYESKPRDLNIVSYSTGTVATSGTTVTGDTTVFPTNCVGSIIRFGTSGSSTAVTNKYGANPFTEQRVITARASDTSVTIDQAATSDYSSGTAYQISDPIDLHPGPMQVAFRRLAEYELARVTGMQDRGERYAAARQALTLALEEDAVASYANAVWHYSPTDDGTVTTA